MYKTIFVKTKKDVRRSTSDRLRSVKVLGEDSAEELTTALNDLEQEGFEVVDISTVTSGSSSNAGTGGWGFSYTDGFTVTAKKK